MWEECDHLHFNVSLIKYMSAFNLSIIKVYVGHLSSPDICLEKQRVFEEHF